ncbi:MAG TPA: PAS domain S-box protein [Gaiellaceae bacterium]|nr:PAS domain S-box protein [Gaiellaceae bacterium]
MTWLVALLGAGYVALLPLMLRRLHRRRTLEETARRREQQALVADIDELKGSEQALRAAAERLSGIVAAQREIAELELDLDAALERVVERARELTGADGAALYFVDGEQLVARVALGAGSDERDPLPIDAGVAGACVRSRDVVTCTDLLEDDRAWPVARRGRDIRSAVLVPLTGEDSVEAVLAVLYSEPNGFDDSAVETARLTAEFAAAALRNARELQAKQELVAALAESEERFRSAIESSLIGLALCSPDDRYLLVNDAYCRIAGRTAKELDTLTWEDLTHDDDIEAGRELKRRLLDGELRQFESEQRLVRGDGEIVWVRAWLSIVRSAEGTPLYGVAQIQDITAQRQLADSLRMRERLLRAVFDQSLSAMILFDDEHTILDANVAAQALSGLEREQLLGMSVDGFAPSDGGFAEIWEELDAAGQLQDETTIMLPDGTTREIVFAARRDVQPGRHLTVIQDVSEQRRLEERLRQGQKMEAVGRLAGGIAHDFNNMLTAIGGYAELLLSGTAPGSAEHRHARQIDGAARRAGALTRQLLAFSRRQVLQPAPLHLNDVVERTRDMTTRLIGEDVRLELRLSPAADPVFADAGQLEQVIVNLAVNARDAMPRGGVLTIETDTVNVDPEQAREAVATPGRYALLSISDTGVGMDAEQLSRLFEPFYSTKGDRGVGLGLATVYGIVRQSGGFVTVQSEPGRGTSFRILLPVTGLAAERLHEDEREPAAPAGNETVLLVEDEELVRAIVCEMLETNGYTVVCASDGEEAVRLAGAHRGDVDVLVTDVVMPRMSGQEVAGRILEIHPRVRTVFVSGYTESAIANHGVLAPGTTFLQKPFSADELSRALRGLLDAAAVT